MALMSKNSFSWQRRRTVLDAEPSDRLELSDAEHFASGVVRRVEEKHGGPFECLLQLCFVEEPRPVLSVLAEAEWRTGARAVKECVGVDKG